MNCLLNFHCMIFCTPCASLDGRRAESCFIPTLAHVGHEGAFWAQSNVRDLTHIMTERHVKSMNARRAASLHCGSHFYNLHKAKHKVILAILGTHSRVRKA